MNLTILSLREMWCFFSSEYLTLLTAKQVIENSYCLCSGQVTTNGTLVDFGESIKKELKERTSLITQIFTYANWVLSLTVILLVIQSYIYLRKYLRDDRHDNNYITRTFETVDEKRMEKGKCICHSLQNKSHFDYA